MKQHLREHFKQLRASMSASERAHIDTAITTQVCALPAFEQAQTVLSYVSFGDEVETRGIIQAAWTAGKQVAVPRVVPETRLLEWFYLTSFNELKTSSFGIEEPRLDAQRVDEAQLGSSVVLVPGLAFDRQGYRLGYGGGFYDVFLAHAPACLVSMGLCREAQLIDELEVREPFDIPVQVVVTEQRVVQL